MTDFWPAPVPAGAAHDHACSRLVLLYLEDGLPVIISLLPLILPLNLSAVVKKGSGQFEQVWVSDAAVRSGSARKAQSPIGPCPRCISDGERRAAAAAAAANGAVRKHARADGRLRGRFRAQCAAGSRSVPV